MNENSITVGEFKEHLEQLDDDDILHLPGGLGFNKIRRAGDNAYMIEQVEMQMFPEEEFLKKNPYFKVAFLVSNDYGDDAININGGAHDLTIK